MTADRLLPSTADTLALSSAVAERFISCVDFHQQTFGFAIKIPGEIEADLVRWRIMVARFRKSDFRNTESELTALRNIAQWTVDVNGEMRNQKPIKVQWRGSSPLI